MFGGQPRRFPAIRDEVAFHHFAGHTDRQRSLVTGCGAQPPSSSKPVSVRYRPTELRLRTTASRRDAHRYSVRIVVGQPICDFARTSPARLGGDIVADVGPGAGAHAPVECRVEIARSLQVLGDHRGVRIRSSAAFYRRGQKPVQLRAIGFELRFISNSSDQRWRTAYWSGSELHLIDEFRLDQRRDIGVVDDAGQEIHRRTWTR